MLRRPWFQSQTPHGLHSAPTEIGTLREVFTALGTPTAQAWPDAQALPNYMQFSACPGQPLSAQFPQARPVPAFLILCSEPSRCIERLLTWCSAGAARRPGAAGAHDGLRPQAAHQRRAGAAAPLLQR